MKKLTVWAMCRFENKVSKKIVGICWIVVLDCIGIELKKVFACVDLNLTKFERKIMDIRKTVDLDCIDIKWKRWVFERYVDLNSKLFTKI